MASKQELQAAFQQNRVKAEEWQKAVKKRLNSMLGVGSRHSLPGGNPNLRPGVAERVSARGGVPFQSGVAPTDQQVSQYIKMLGGNPYTKKAQEAKVAIGNRPKGGAVSTGISKEANKMVDAQMGTTPKAEEAARKVEAERAVKAQKAQEQLQTFLKDAQSQQDKANAANEARYADILGRLESSKERNLERVENYGVAAGNDLEERAAESLGNTRANLSARGLGNSTIFDSFRQRNDRDLAREQQRLSEQVDSRTAEYDQKLTGDIAGFMERRTDQAPDYGQIATLAQQFGLSGDGQGFNYGSGSNPAAAPVASSVPPNMSNLMTRSGTSVQAPAPAVAPGGVPQPDLSGYQQGYQRPQGVSARTAQQMQNPMGNFSGFSMFGGGGGGQQQQQQYTQPADPGLTPLPPWKPLNALVDPRFAYGELRDKNRANRLAELKAATAAGRAKNLAYQERKDIQNGEPGNDFDFTPYNR